MSYIETVVLDEATAAELNKLSGALAAAPRALLLSVAAVVVLLMGSL